LGRGFLTGAINESTTFDSADFRNKLPRFTSENRKANQAVVDVIAGSAARMNATPAQVALAWLLVLIGASDPGMRVQRTSDRPRKGLPVDCLSLDRGGYRRVFTGARAGRHAG
jgi:hypothetical protein